MEPLNHDDPRRVGPYQLVGRLGVGGMGQVFLGREPGGRAVAVKLVRADLLDTEGVFRRRFAREVAAARAVRSPFTVPVAAADPDADTPWLATAYLPGITLAEAVGVHGPLPARTLRHLAGGLAVALDHIHGAGLVHRDMKPSNVLLTVDGPRVIDFGIALLSGATTITRTEQTLGSLAFMSPEQFDSAAVGPASDVFSCGVVLAYAASARIPFGQGPLPVLLANITMRDPDLHGVPREFTGLIRACLAKRPEDRPSAGELLAGLEDSAEAARVHLDEGWLPGDVVHRVLRIATSVLGAEGTGRNEADGGVPDAGQGGPNVPPHVGPRHPSIPPPPVGMGHGPGPGPAPATDTPHPGGPTATGRAFTRRRGLYLGVGALVAGVPAAAWLLLDRDNAKGAGVVGSGKSPGPGPGGPRVLWTREVGSKQAPPGTPALSGGRVVVSLAGERVVAFDAATGAEAWQGGAYDPAAGKSSATHAVPVIANGLVYTPGGNPAMLALDQATGQERWRRPTPERKSHSIALGHGAGIDTGTQVVCFCTTPDTSDEGLTDAFLHVVDAVKGEELWSLDLKLFVSGSPVVSDSLAFIADNNSRVVAVDLVDREVSWTFTELVSGPNVDPFYGVPAVDADSVYYVTTGGKIASIAKWSGFPNWILPAPGKFGDRSSVTVSAGTVFTASTEGILTAFDRTNGSQKWSQRLGGGALSTPVAGQGKVYVASSAGLTALDAATGQTSWTVPEAKGGSAPVLLVDRTVYVPDPQGALRAVSF